MSELFEGFVADFHAHFATDPNACLFKGVDQRQDELPNPTLAASEAAHDRAASLRLRVPAMREELAASGALDFETELDLDLADWALGAEQEYHSRTFNGLHRRQQQPRVGDCIGDGIFMMLINDPREASQRLSDITSRIEAIPSFIDGTLDRLERPVRYWVEMDDQKVEGLPQLLSTVTDWAETSGADAAAKSRLADANNAAEIAFKRFRAGLSELPTTNDFHVGHERAQEIIASRGVELSIDELHQVATAFLARTKDQIQTLRASLAKRYELDPDIDTAPLQEWLNERYAVDLGGGNIDAILGRYAAEESKIMDFIEARDLFPILDDQTMKIVRTPGFMEPSIPAGAMLQPPAFRTGTRTSIIYLTLHADQLDDHTELSIPSMMIHEGIPGHHLQLAWGAAHKSVIRRHLEPMEQAEGWTTMLEDYMLDQGYMNELEDEARFIGKRDISRIGARVAIDLFFMTGDRTYLDVGVDADIHHEDPFEAAISLLRAVTGFSHGRARTEVQWYSQERGYPLCYLTGNHLVWQLKKEVENKLGGPSLEVDRKFHSTYLNAGLMPVSFLRRVYEHEGLL